MEENGIASYARKEISRSLEHKSLAQNESMYELEERINTLPSKDYGWPFHFLIKSTKKELWTFHFLNVSKWCYRFLNIKTQFYYF